MSSHVYDWFVSLFSQTGVISKISSIIIVNIIIIISIIYWTMMVGYSITGRILEYYRGEPVCKEIAAIRQWAVNPVNETVITGHKEQDIVPQRPLRVRNIKPTLLCFWDTIKWAFYIKKQTNTPYIFSEGELSSSYWHVLCASFQIRKIAGCACAGNAGNVFPATDFKGNR